MSGGTKGLAMVSNAWKGGAGRPCSIPNIKTTFQNSTRHRKLMLSFGPALPNSQASTSVQPDNRYSSTQCPDRLNIKALRSFSFSAGYVSWTRFAVGGGLTFIVNQKFVQRSSCWNHRQHRNLLVRDDLEERWTISATTHEPFQ
jgi:hypothetical protein